MARQNEDAQKMGVLKTKSQESHILIIASLQYAKHICFLDIKGGVSMELMVRGDLAAIANLRLPFEVS